jgi:hypothetical protein
MDMKGFVVPPGQAPVLEMSKTGRSVALMLQSEATAESVMMFEETAPGRHDNRGPHSPRQR